MNTPQRTLFSPHITYVAPVTHPEPPPLPVSPGSSPAEKGAAIRSIILRKDDQIARARELELEPHDDVVLLQDDGAELLHGTRGARARARA